VWAGGHILGDVIAGEGEAVAITIGSVRGVVRSGLNQVRVWAPGGTGRSSSGYPYDDPAMDWLMVLTNGEPGEHIGSVIGRTAAGGTELISATFADPPAQPPTPADPDRVKKAADDLKQKPRGMAPPTDLMGKFRDDWTKEEYLRRAEEVTQWWKNLSAADADDLQDWWQTATDAERKDLLKDLLNSDSPTQRDFYLYKRIGEPVNPPPQPPAQPPPGPPAKEGPTDEQLKDWAKKAEEYLKGSAAQADEKIRADDDEKDRRARGIRWRDHAATRMEVRLGKDKDDPEVVKLRGESKQLQDRVNFGVDKGATLDPVPLNDAAKAQVAALRQEVAELRTIKDMGMADKLKAVFERAINAKGPDGKPKLEQAIIDGLKEAIQPQNLATMAAVMGVIGASTFTPAGPIVMSAATAFGYIMTGKAVLDVGEDLFMFFVVAVRARRPQDFDKAADHLIAAYKKLAEEAGGAAVGFGAGKVAKGVGNLKKVADAGGEPAKNMVNRRADGKMQVNDGQPKAPPPVPQPPPQPPPQGIPPEAGLLGVLVGVRRRFRPPQPPNHLSDPAKALWTNLYQRYGPKIIDAVTRDAGGDAAKAEQALKHLDTITSNLLKRTDWVQMHPKNPERRLDNDDQIRAVLVRVFGNMNPGGPLSNPKFDRQAFLRDLAEVSDLRGFSSELGQLKSAQAQVRGYVAEIQAAAADRRAGKVVEDLDLHVEVNRTGTKIEKTDIDIDFRRDLVPTQGGPQPGGHR